MNEKLFFHFLQSALQKPLCQDKDMAIAKTMNKLYEEWEMVKNKPNNWNNNELLQNYEKKISLSLFRICGTTMSVCVLVVFGEQNRLL